MSLANAAAAAVAAAAAAAAAQRAQHCQHPVFPLTKSAPKLHIPCLFFPRLLLDLLELSVRILLRKTALRLQMQPLHSRVLVIVIVPRDLLATRLVQRGNNNKLVQFNVRVL